MSDTPPEEFYSPDPPTPMLKKTREVPNLAECHSCGFRINNTNGQGKLRSLRSEWRIVLLCAKCYRRCVSGDLCTYCLGEFSGEVEVEVEGEERFRCGECCRCVHIDCMCKYSEFPPWSYFDWRSLPVCVDCWLPSKVKKLRVVERGRVGGNFGGGTKRLTDESGKYAAEKRVKLVEKPRMALKDKDESFCKEMVVKVGVGKENGGSCFVADGGLGKNGKGVDDAELAIQLHRVMNSSPRILTNPKSSSISLVNTMKRQPQAGRNVSSVKKYHFGQKNCGDRGEIDPPVNEGSDFKDEGAERILKEGQGSCSDNSMNSESFSWKELDLPKPELKFTYVCRKSRRNVGERPDRYMFKYSRKRSRMIDVVARTYTYLYERSAFVSETSFSAIIPHSPDDSRNIPDSCILAFPVSICANGSSQINGQEG